MIRKQTKKWKCKNGRMMRVCDMSDGHLTNAMALIERVTARRHSDAIRELLSMPAPTAEIASDCFDSALDEALQSDWQDDLPDIYYSMGDELERRRERGK